MIKRLYQLPLVCSFAITVAVVAGYILANPASLETKQLAAKEARLRGPASEKTRVQGKAMGLFNIEIRSLVPVVNQAGDTIALEATVTARHDIQGAEFSWNLPEGITATSVTTGKLDAMHAGESKTISFEGVSATAENKQIHLHVFKMVGGERMGATAQYNSRDQEKIIARNKATIEKRLEETGENVKVVQ